MLIDSQEKLQDLQRELVNSHGPIVIDTETSWNSRYQDRYLLGISIAYAGNDGSHSAYIPVKHNPMMDEAVPNVTVSSDFLQVLSDASAETKRVLLFHEALFDEIVLDRANIKLPDLPIYCTRNMSVIVNEDYIDGHELSAVGKRYVGKEAVKEIELKKAMKNFGWEQIPPMIMGKYAEQDALLPAAIYSVLKPQFTQWEDYWVRERQFTGILKKMIMKGIPVDVEKIKELKGQCELDLISLKEQIGFDPNKKKEAIERLFSDPPVGLGLSVINRTPKRGDPQIDDDFLSKTNHPICGLIRQYNKTETQLTLFYRKYLELADENYSRMHPGFKQNGAVTGRPTCSNPNVFQIPRDGPIKSIYLAELGKELWEFDFKNVEWYFGAIYSNAQLLNDLRAGADMHLKTANALGIDRQSAKIGGFTWLFSGGWKAIVEQLNVPEQRAKKFIQDMNRTYPDIYATMQKAMRTAEQNKYIKIWTGRRRHFNHPGYYYTAFNFLTQGGSFEMLKEALIRLDNAGFDIRNCIYDSAWIMLDKSSAKEDIKEVKHIMNSWHESAFGITIPVEEKLLHAA